MESSWEELDVDDSDLPSFLRPKASTLLPCKRQHSNNSSHTLEPCSQIPCPSQSELQTLVSQSEQRIRQPCSQIPRASQSQTLDSQSEQPLHQVDQQKKEQSLPSTSSPRLIPGPAGAVQAAMYRRQSSVRKPNNSHGCGKDRKSTQEYFGISQEDEDFKRNSWLRALDFLRKDGFTGDSTCLEKNFVLRSPLSSIKKCISIDRVPQVVAVIESCTPNGFGDLIVTLKDPTGTIGASIHRKVLKESNFGKDITVGSVLILQKVAVFSPSRSAHYLNITLRNMLKVIGKDCGPPSTLAYSVSTPLICVASGTEDCRENRSGMKGKGSVEDGRQSKDGSPAARNFHCSSSGRHQRAASEVELLLVRQGMPKEVTMEAVKRDGNDEEQTMGDNNRSAAMKFVNHPNDQETGRVGGIQLQQQQLISKTSLPQWTDEQLDELFAASCDDGTCLF